MNIIGIDPGLSGGIAFWNSNAFEFQVHAWKMPETELDIFDRLEELEASSSDGIFAYLEEVHSMPSDSSKGAFTFGRNYGGLRMALLGLGIPFTTVTPQVWQKHMRCRTRGDKRVSKAKAQELFPGLTITHATADALLIMEYGRQVHR